MYSKYWSLLAISIILSASFLVNADSRCYDDSCTTVRSQSRRFVTPQFKDKRIEVLDDNRRDSTLYRSRIDLNRERSTIRSERDLDRQVVDRRDNTDRQERRYRDVEYRERLTAENRDRRLDNTRRVPERSRRILDERERRQDITRNERLPLDNHLARTDVTTRDTESHRKNQINSREAREDPQRERENLSIEREDFRKGREEFRQENQNRDRQDRIHSTSNRRELVSEFENREQRLQLIDDSRDRLAEEKRFERLLERRGNIETRERLTRRDAADSDRRLNELDHEERIQYSAPTSMKHHRDTNRRLELYPVQEAVYKNQTVWLAFQSIIISAILLKIWKQDDIKSTKAFESFKSMANGFGQRLKLI